ncbi:hypothetical protein ABZR88_08125 [Mucilaginibacter yixingensis]
MKWVKSDLAASELYAFIGKIENKFHGTLGIFISRNELSENFIGALNKGRRQSVIVIHGEDLDMIFKRDFKFREYIAHVIKILSYDNVVHYPVSKFLETRIKPTTDAPTADINSDARQFITQQLLGSAIDKDRLAAELSLGDVDTFNIVYNYVLNHYYKVLQDSRRTFDPTRRQNFRTFLELYRADKMTMLKQAANFYNNLIPAHFEEYAAEPFITLFTPYFIGLAVSERSKFEQFVVKKFSEISQWDDENRITELLEPLWSMLTPVTKEVLSDFYLDIFITDRLDKFAQKSFANKLVASGDIKTNEISKWLDTKLIKAVQSYSGLVSEDTIRMIASTYSRVARPLNVELKDWIAFVSGRIKLLTKS